ncbi:MAG: CHASE2 domain-containing protein [Cyanobacteria bacterium P01_F01_bin.150]
MTAPALSKVNLAGDSYLVPHDVRLGNDRLHHKLVVLSFEGSLAQQGFRVAAEIGLDGERSTWQHRGQLPPDPKLLKLLTQWRRDYSILGDKARLFMRLTPLEIDYTGSINDPFAACRQSAHLLQQRLQQWLIQADSFQHINLRLREFCNLEDRIRVIISADDLSIYRLPWHQWDFIDRYQRAEVAFSGLTMERVPWEPNYNGANKVKILAILGDPCDIDIEGDRALLQALPNADVTFLVQPDRSIITDQLWDRPWDILFFAGHSKTETCSPESCQTLNGRVYLNRTDSLSLDELTFGLRQAINQGLRLAIFNSCDGLGLASALEKLHLPQFIVMREPIPDKIAQTFLNRFLQRFSSGSSFYRSVRQAREQLQGLEQNYPCASWLPVIYQNVSARSLYWNDFLGSVSSQSPTIVGTPPSIEHRASASLTSNPISQSVRSIEEVDLLKKERGTESVSSTQNTFPLLTTTKIEQPQNPNRLSIPLQCAIHSVFGLCIAGIIIGLRNIGWLETPELKAYDHLMALRPKQTLPDNRLLIISIDDEDIQYQRQQQMVLDGSLSDAALLKLLKKIEIYRPASVGIDILHDFDFATDLANHIERRSHIFAICRDKTPGQPGVPPPSNLSRQQIGFTNTPLDSDGIVRRQFLGEPKDDTLCPTQESLAFQLAQRYLDKVAGQGMEWITEAGLEPNPLGKTVNYPKLVLGNTSISKITRRAGGYHLPDGEDGGYQILINYRATPPNRVTLREILSGTLDSQLPDLINNRVILIGVVDNKTDLHMTPYNQGTPMNAIAGVMIQAQTVSHIISAVIDNRPLIQWWSEIEEALWILAWGTMGGLSIALCSSIVPRWGIVGSGCVLIYVGSLALLLQGLWVPFIPASLTFLVVTLTPLKTLKIRVTKLNQ